LSKTTWIEGLFVIEGSESVARSYWDDLKKNQLSGLTKSTQTEKGR
jgi:hypothetical protein